MGVDQCGEWGTKKVGLVVVFDFGTTKVVSTLQV